MSSHSNPPGGTRAPSSTLRMEVLERVAKLIDSSDSAEVRSCVADAVDALERASESAASLSFLNRARLLNNLGLARFQAGECRGALEAWSGRS